MSPRKITESEIDAKACNPINKLADQQLQGFIITAYHMLRTLKLDITRNGTLVHNSNSDNLKTGNLKTGNPFELYIEIDKFNIISVSQFERVLSKELTNELLDIMNKKNQSKHCLHHYPNVSIVATHVVDNMYYINMICSSFR